MQRLHCERGLGSGSLLGGNWPYKGGGYRLRCCIQKVTAKRHSGLVWKRGDRRCQNLLVVVSRQRRCRVQKMLYQVTVALGHSCRSLQAKVVIGIGTINALAKGVEDQLGRGQTEVEIHASMMPRQGRSHMRPSGTDGIHARQGCIIIHSNGGQQKWGFMERKNRYGALNGGGLAGHGV
jgi:hypothetical protein